MTRCIRWLRHAAIFAIGFLALAAHGQSLLWYQATQAQPLVGDTAQHAYATTPSSLVSITGTRAGVHVVGGPLTIDILPPSTGDLNTGDYENAYLAPGNGRVPGLSVKTSSFACSTASGRFWIDEFNVDANGNLLHVAIDFEYRCNGTAAPIYGEIRYNSTQLLTIDKPANSTRPDVLMFPWRSAVPRSTLVTSDTLRVYGINAPAAISVTGGEYSVNGGPWTTAPGTVQNLDLVTVRTTTASVANTTSSVILSVDMIMAIFNAQTYDPSQLLDGFTLSSGDNILANGAHQYTSGQVWDFTSSFSTTARTSTVSVVATGAPDQRYVMSFSPPPGQMPAGPGAYENAALYSVDAVRYDWRFGPALQVYSGLNDSCFSERGRFVILEQVVDPGGNVLRFAADFEQHCEGLEPALFGAVRYHSTIAAPPVQLPPARCGSHTTSLPDLQAEVDGLAATTQTKQELTNTLLQAQSAQEAGETPMARRWIGTFMQQVVNRSILPTTNQHRIEFGAANLLTCGAANVLLNVSGMQ